MFNKIFLSSAILLLASSCNHTLMDDTNSHNRSFSMHDDLELMSYKNNDTVFFEFDKSDLSERAKKKLDFHVYKMKQSEKDDFLIVGHADERGPRVYNIALGERRANSVKEYLVSKGIDADRLKVDSMGKESLRCDTTRPIYNILEGGDKDKRDIYHRQNRRSVIMPDDGTIDHNDIVQKESKRCIISGMGHSEGESDGISSNNITDGCSSGVVFVVDDSEEDLDFFSD